MADICYNDNNALATYTGIYDEAIKALDRLHDSTSEEDWAAIGESKPAKFSTSAYMSGTAMDDPFNGLAIWFQDLQTIGPKYDSVTLNREVIDLFLTSDVQAAIAADPAGSPVSALTEQSSADKLYKATMAELEIILASSNAKRLLLNWVRDYQEFIKYRPNSQSERILGGSDGDCISSVIASKYALGIRILGEGKELFDVDKYVEDPSLWIDDVDERVKAMEDAAKKRQDEVAAAGEAAVQSVLRNEILFREQCFLLAKIFQLTGIKRGSELTGADPTLRAEGQMAWAKPLPYYGSAGNASLLMDGDPYAFINLLTQHPAQDAFFDMTTAQISSLQPMIRLFKIIEDPTNPNKETQQEFNFDSYASKRDVESIFNNTAKRGFGVGIKNFTFSYDGSNPFSAKKSIKAQLRIFATSFDELLVDRGGYKYADLALKTGKTKTPSPDGTQSSDACLTLEDMEENLSKLNFRLKAVIGFARPSGDTSLFTEATERQSQSLLGAIGESYVTLNLTPTIHDFNIDEMGRVTFTINYLAYIEDFFDQPQFNVFYKEDAAVRIMGRKFQYETLTKKCEADLVGEWKEDLAESGDIRRDKFWNMQALMTRLRNNKKIRYISVGIDELFAFATKGPFYETGKRDLEVSDSPSSKTTQLKDMQEIYESQFKQDNGGSGDDQLSKEMSFRSNELAVALQATNPKQEHISFFYVSDLVDVILQSIEERLATFSKEAIWTKFPLSAVGKEEKLKEIALHKKFYDQYERFRVLLGPLEIVDSKDNGPSQFINFGDIPISTRYFMEWLSEKLLKKEQTEYNLTKFLTDLFNTLISNFLNTDDCFSGFNTKQKLRLNQATITAYKPDGRYKWGSIQKWILNNDGQRPNIGNMDHPVLNISGPQDLPIGDGGVENEINYLVFFAGRTQPTEQMRGSRSEDVRKGIFHYLIGRPQGIVKNISLSKTDAKYLKEVRFQQEGFDGLEQLREVYDVNVDCFANVKTFPGTYIYVDPRSFAPNTTSYDGGTMDLTRFGIGGYCMIIRSEHTFGPGQADTKITAKWVAQKYNEEEEKCKVKKKKGTGDNSKGSCPSWATNRLAAAKG
tara:strand:- start:535 stop:3786 length:3252 start_codon:yes stop_codon:yes gene_type:complete